MVQVYKIGDRVVYPMHGAGVIIGIENREILGEIQEYYVMEMPIGDMSVLIPCNHVTEIGVRELCPVEVAHQVLDILQNAQVEVDSNWNKRYRDNMLKIKSGDICEVAYVMRRLLKRDHEKGLSTGERKMLNSAKQILLSELCLIQGIDSCDVESLFERLCARQEQDLA